MYNIYIIYTNNIQGLKSGTMHENCDIQQQVVEHAWVLKDVKYMGYTAVILLFLYITTDLTQQAQNGISTLNLRQWRGFYMEIQFCACCACIYVHDVFLSGYYLYSITFRTLK